MVIAYAVFVSNLLSLLPVLLPSCVVIVVSQHRRSLHAAAGITTAGIADTWISAARIAAAQALCRRSDSFQIAAAAALR